MRHISMGAPVEDLGLEDRVLVTMEHAGGQVNAETLWHGAVGAPSAGHKEPFLARVTAWLRGGWKRRDTPDRPAPARVARLPISSGLLAHIEAYYNTRRTAGEGVGPRYQLVSTPFLHYAITCSDGVSGRASHLVSQLHHDFADHLGDQAVGEVRFALSRQVSGQGVSGFARVQFGHGIYVPGEFEPQTWLMEVAQADVDDWCEVTFHGLGRPAGLYREQEAIIFAAHDENLTPAVVGNGALEMHTAIFFGRVDEGEPKLRSFVRRPDSCELSVEASPYRDPILDGAALQRVKRGEPIMVPRRDGNGGFRLRFGHPPHRFAMLHERPAGPRLALVGLALPKPGRQRLPHNSGTLQEWWFDLSEQGKLPERPFDAYAFSVAADPRRVRVFNWRDFEDVERLRAGRTAQLQDGRLRLRLDELSSQPKLLWDQLVRIEGDGAFAFGELPSTLDLGVKLRGDEATGGAEARPLRKVVDWFETCGGFTCTNRGERAFRPLGAINFTDDSVRLSVTEAGLELRSGRPGGNLPDWVGTLSGRTGTPAEAEALHIRDGGEFLFGWYLFRYEAN